MVDAGSLGGIEKGERERGRVGSRKGVMNDKINYIHSQVRACIHYS